jgi:hypothetical protein
LYNLPLNTASFLKKFLIIEVEKTQNSYLDKLILSKKTLKPKNIKKEIFSDPEFAKFRYTYRPNYCMVDLNEDNCEYFFVRKNKSFNKSRFARNRQFYRTGVYFCFYINIVVFYSL